MLVCCSVADDSTVSTTGRLANLHVSQSCFIWFRSRRLEKLSRSPGHKFNISYCFFLSRYPTMDELAEMLTAVLDYFQ